MSKRRFVFYLNGVSRSIVITDQNDDMTLEEASNNASNLMLGDKISKFGTKTDTLLVKPTDIQAIHIIDDQIGDTTESDDSNLQSFVPDIDLDEIDGDEEDIQITEDDITNNNSTEEDNTEEDVVIPEEKIEDDVDAAKTD